MATEITMPKLGFSMNEGEIAEWMFGDGERVEKGEVLFAIESDKSTTEIESPASGTLKVLVQAGATKEVGEVLGLIE